MCHRGKGSAGYFGAEGTDCDAPLSLVNETFRWIETNLKDEIDFVVWTGDSARHDSDDKVPRTVDEVIDLNKLLTDGFTNVFRTNNTNHGHHGLSIPIVPTFGNNDVMPHNVFKDGPNRWTKAFLDVWKAFIPESQRHSFVEGGWFTKEVIPGKLAVISLNTLYFFESNNAADGCDSKSEPGYEHMEWLRVQLKLLRNLNMKAILIGHVPPARSGSKQNWDESCWQKYTLWLRQYRDVVVGSLYGHMNIDHFILQDKKKVDITKLKNGRAVLGTPNESQDISIASRADYLASLRDQWSKMPSPPSDLTLDADERLSEDPWDLGDAPSIAKSKKKKKKRFLKKIGGPWAERYSVSLVSPSLVPNYFPSLRVIEYNISGLEEAPIWADVSFTSKSHHASSYDDDEIDGEVSQMSNATLEESSDKVTDKKKKKKKSKFKVPEPPSSSAPPGPAYSNQALTWLGYTQYFANITRINKEIAKSQQSARNSPEEAGKHSQDFFEVEYDTRIDKLYKMHDLTVCSFFKLATRIAKDDPSRRNAGSSTPDDACNITSGGQVSNERTSSENKTSMTKKKKKDRLWKTFLGRAFVGFLDVDDLDGGQ